PVETYGNDAPILYHLNMSPLTAMGVHVDVESRLGPVIDNPVSSKNDIERLDTLSPDEDVAHVLDSIKVLTREELSVRLIGVSGAPFTLASYMIEGRPSKTYGKTKAFMYKTPESWYLLMDKLGDMIIDYTKAQIKAGVSAIQIFDSWVGALNADDYRTYIKPVMSRIF